MTGNAEAQVKQGEDSPPHKHPRTCLPSSPEHWVRALRGLAGFLTGQVTKGPHFTPRRLQLTGFSRSRASQILNVFPGSEPSVKDIPEY